MADTTEQGSTTGRGVSRRKAMLVTGAAVAGASALMAAPFRARIRNVARRVAISTPLGRRLLSLADGTYEEWANEVGTDFALGARTSIRLVGVRPLESSGPRPQNVRTQGFAAFFDPVGGQSVAPELIYTAIHPAYGAVPLFLGSASTSRTPGRLVAVFG